MTKCIDVRGCGSGRGKKKGTKENKYTDIEIVEWKTGKEIPNVLLNCGGEIYIKNRII